MIRSLSVGMLIGLLGIGICTSNKVFAVSVHPALMAQVSPLEEANRLEEQVIQLHLQGKYTDAIPLAEKVLAIRRQNLQVYNPLIAKILHSLAIAYYAQDSYEKSKLLYQEALALWEKAFGPNHPDVARCLNDLALLYEVQGDYAEAKSLYQRALKIREKVLGPEHPDVASSIHSLAGLYETQGRYAEAEPLYQRSLKIKEKALGPEHPYVATSLYNLASLYETQGRYAEAELLHQRALKLREKAFGPEHPDVASSLNGLAGLYETQGHYAEAEPLYQRALKLYEKFFGSEHSFFATSLNNLAGLYETQGRYAEAEPLYQKALKLREKAFGPEHPDVASSLHSLARLYETQGRYGEAEPLYQEALKIEKKILGFEHPDVANSFYSLAGLYETQGRYGEAEPLYQKALKIEKKILGSEHPDVASSLHSLAFLYVNQGRYGEAKPLYQRALKIVEKALGPKHPNVATGLYNLGVLYWANNNYDQALLEFVRSLNIEEINLAQNLSIGGEQQKRDYLAQFQGTTNGAISLHLQQTPNNPQSARLALTTILRRKGRILDVLGQSFPRLRQTADPQTLSQLNQLQDLYNQRSLLASRNPAQLPPQAYQQQLQTLQTQTQQLEDSLSRSSAALQQQFTPVQIEQVQKAIPTNAVLVEFILYQPFNPKAKPKERFGSSRYAAYVLTPPGDIRWIDLGPATDLDPLIKAFRQSVADSSVQVSKGQKQPAQALYQKLFQPVRSLIGNAQHLLIAPDGPLNLIPFEALVDGQNQYLLETYQIAYLSSGRDLLRLNLPSPQAQPPLLITNPDYGPIPQNTQSLTASNRSSAQQRSLDLSEYVEPLSGTALEGSALSKLIPQGRLLTETQASESALKKSPNPSLLHIATHGFFLKDRPLPKATDTAALRTYENPLLRSGLALAGFNRRQEANQDDGVLTALEISGLDFRATQQVTLSACQTGLGDIVNGEGVYGLRRAFTLAGAQSQLMSLWNVNDPATQTMMVAYYQRLQQGQPRGDALRQIQLQMIKGQLKNNKGETYQHPYFWAAFVRTGDWRPLQKF